MIIDTHCHYNLEPLLSNWQRYWADAQAAGVEKAIIVGTNPDTSQVAIELCAQNPDFRASVGIHPEEASHLSTQEIDQAIEQIEQLLTQNHPQVVAVGEIGLDYFRIKKNTEEFTQLQAKQRQLFLAQLNLAKKYSLPAILHVRDTDWPETPDDTNAYWQVVEIMHKEWPAGKPFILHCLSGPLAYTQAMIKHGAYVGIDGNITYKNAEPLREIIRQLPKDRILLETDAPYLPPVPHRGKTCEPAMIKLTGEYVENELEITKEKVYKNSKSIFTSL